MECHAGEASGSSAKPARGSTGRTSAQVRCGAASGSEPVPCYFPLNAYQVDWPNPETGKRPIVFKYRRGVTAIQVPCGRCIGCKLKRSHDWAVRCVHEAQLHEESCFLTLTYDPEHLPVGGTLIKKHFQDFMKRLRRRFPSRPLQYFHCGEYGDEKRRPHYHALLFGMEFSDKLHHATTPRGDRVFTSATLSEVWGKGFCTIGALTYESAAYTARYCLKKITGEEAAGWYTEVDADGEIHQLLPEYITMSLKRPIGKGWMERYHGDVYPDDFTVIRGKRMKPPKFYDKLYELRNPDGYAELKAERKAFALENWQDSTPERLAVRRTCKEAQISTLKRELK